MKRYECNVIIFLTVVVMLGLTNAGMAANDRYVDKSNWQVLNGLMPENALNWVKTGEMIVRYGNLTYDPAKVMPSWVLESKKENVGKYKLSDKGAIVETATGKYPKFIKGIPFPDIRRNDPDAAAKVMWNASYMRNAQGALRNLLELKFYGRNTGYERSYWVDWYSKPFDAYEPGQSEPNPNNFESVNQIVIKSPYDMAGTAMMTWRYRTNKENMQYGYVPAIRRVRQLTPSGRSDALFGSDYCQDDGGYSSYDGAINYFNWKMIGEGECIGAFVGDNPCLVTRNNRGEMEFELAGRVQFSYEKKGPRNSAAPWFMDSAVWAKRPVWIIEGIPKDTYYNFGRQIFYVDKETNLAYWKVIHDRNGKYWRMHWNHWAFGQDANKETSWIGVLISTVLDERIHHASTQNTTKYRCGGKIDTNQFSLGGFTALCK